MYSESADFSEKNAVIDALWTGIQDILGSPALDRKRRDWLAIEIGGSGGLLGGMISNAVRKVICTDVENAQAKCGGEFGKLLLEKFKRNDREFDLRKIDFYVEDAQDLSFKDNLFDLYFSLNTYEHIPNPEVALREAFRVLKPGGALFISFDPVWTADSGSHFFYDFHPDQPWAHLLLTDDEFCERMKVKGAVDWQLAGYRNDMNRRPSWYYKEVLQRTLGSLASRFKFNEWSGCIDPAFLRHPNLLAAASKLGCSPKDLTIRGFSIFAVK